MHSSELLYAEYFYTICFPEEQTLDIKRTKTEGRDIAISRQRLLGKRNRNGTDSNLIFLKILLLLNKLKIYSFL